MNIKERKNETEGRKYTIKTRWRDLLDCSCSCLFIMEEACIPLALATSKRLENEEEGQLKFRRYRGRQGKRQRVREREGGRESEWKRGRG